MTAAAPVRPPEPTPLPRLRRDLKIELVPVRGGGFPSVIVTDPVRGSYFRLTWPESGILLLWQDASSVEDLCDRLAGTYGIATTKESIGAVAQFVAANQLTVDQNGSWTRYAALHTAAQHGWIKTLIHGYLFFRIPLLHPEPKLRRLLPRLSFVFARSFWVLVAAVALLGLYLAARQWTAIVSAAQEIFRLEGLFVYATVILGLKAIHECGHGLATVRYGCRVPTMGVAVMLGMPVFYTDTSDSWRLAKRSERLKIVFAGVAAEAIVASVAILLWSFLPDGLTRQICFALATTSILLSISINLNPFMRYDGYFALSDYWSVPNLQPRAFDLGTWKLRELLFGLGHPPPEQLPRPVQRKLIVYALLTAIYRLFLFLGIAALVYVMFGKALGILLGVIEIGIFIVMPIAREVGAWWALRLEIITRQRARWTFGVSAAALAILFVPWMSTVEAPAVLTAETEEALYLPFASRLASIDVVDGQIVQQGDILFRADAADLEQQQKKALLDLRALEFQVGRLHASTKERDERVVIESRLLRAREKVEAIQRQLAQLVVRAPFDGRVVDVDPEISAGLWLNQKRPLARLVSSHGIRAKGLTSDAEIARIAPGARAVFVPDDAAVPRHTITLTTIAPAGDGGHVPVGEERGELRARQGWFEVTFGAHGAPPAQVLRGVVRVEAKTTSPALHLWREIARVLVREHSF
jgi:putative peptide zinc metalloprotease protein